MESENQDSTISDEELTKPSQVICTLKSGLETLAKKLLNWDVEISREEGMRRTFEYFKGLSQEELYKSEHKDFSNHIKK